MGVATISKAAIGLGATIRDARRPSRLGPSENRVLESGAELEEEVRLRLSEEGLRTARFDRVAIDAAAADDWPADAVALPELIEFHRCMASAQAQLRRAAARLGMDPDERVFIDTTDGGFRVVTTSGRAAALQSAIDRDDGLRSALIGAYSTAHITRIGTAVGMAIRASRANPADESAYFDWATAIARRALEMEVRFTFERGVLSAMLVDDQVYAATRRPA